VQLNLFTRWRSRAPAPKPDALIIGQSQVPLHLVRNLRARRYVLRVRRDGMVRVTIPRGGSREFALAFARNNSAWVEKQLLQRSAELAHSTAWGDGTEFLFHGQPVRLTVRPSGELAVAQFGEHTVMVRTGMTDLRPAIENYLWSLAEKELLPRVAQLASAHQLKYHRAVIRNQRSRWGSCSPQRTISLNWRLIQGPPWVSDYMILHELMHLREMNHSSRFWRSVAAACPDFARAEFWLDQHSHLLR
jgi:predicted metal-dependent hydrolase